MEIPTIEVNNDYSLTAEMDAFIRNPNNKIFIEEAMVKATLLRRLIRDEVVGTLG